MYILIYNKQKLIHFLTFHDIFLTVSDIFFNSFSQKQEFVQKTCFLPVFIQQTPEMRFTMKVLTSTIPATAAPSQTAALLCACFHTAHAAGDFIFFDIETTGFSGDTSQLYLIGCVYHDGFGWKLIQWFADSPQGERELLDAFFSFLSRFKTLVHFNGDGFDIPYLLKCCRRLGLPYTFDSIASVDIYKK